MNHPFYPWRMPVVHEGDGKHTVMETRCAICSWLNAHPYHFGNFRVGIAH